MDIATEADVGQERALDDTGIDNADAFAMAYERYRLQVYRYLRARGVGEEDALDLTAVTFERAFAGRHAFRPHDGGLGAWLFRIARNAAIDTHRRRRPEGPFDELAPSLAMRDDGAWHERQEMHDAVARLPDSQRDAIWLRYAAGLSAREIGHVLDRSEAAVQKQIQRGLETLREALR